MNLSKTLNTLSTVLLCLVALVTPLSLPIPKVFILAALALLLLATWAGRIFVENRVTLTRSPFNLPLLAILGIFIAATVLSQSPYQSLLGMYGNFYPSLLGIVSLLIIYFVVASRENTANTNSVGRKIAFAWFVSVSLLSLIITLETFGIGWNVLRQLGMQATSLQLALLATLTLPLGLELLIKAESLWLKPVLGLGTLVCFVAALIFAITPIYILLAVVLLVFLFLMPRGHLKANAPFLVIPAALAILSILVLKVPLISETLGINLTYNQDIVLDTPTSWRITAATFADFPIFGSGPGTFLTDFTKYRPSSFNTSPFWNVRFTRPVNDLFLVLCELGLLGILGFFYLGRAILKIVRPWGTDNPSLVTFLLGSTLAWILIPSSLEVQGIFFLGLGLLSARSGRHLSLPLPKVVSGIALGITALLLTGGGYWIWRFSTAELVFARAQQDIIENKGVAAYENLGKAILKNPYSDTYRRNYAQINLGLANNLAAQETLSDEDKKTVRQLIQQAIREVRIASERLGPQNVANWEARVQIYRGITGLAQDAEQWVVDSLQTAIQLDPTNPLLRIDLGGMFFAQEDYGTAAGMFVDAVRLKPDLANAHYNLAWALNGLGNIREAVTQMELVIKLIPEEGEDYQKAMREIESWRAQLPVEASEEMPTVEELEGVPEELKEASPSAQPPLEKPE